MNKYSCAIPVLLLVTLTDPRISSAQSSATTPVAETTFIAEPLTVETPTGMLYGTLNWPQSSSAVPVVLIISGSGPTDRDGNSPMLKGPNNSLKLLAEGLAAHGIASLRYDKRGIGETGKAMQLAAEKTKTMLREEDLRFEIFIDDAVSWCRKLRTDSRFSSLTLLGHSEGSLIAMVAAERTDAQAYVSIAGSGRPAQQIILEQVRARLLPEMVKATEDTLNKLVAGKTVEEIPPALSFLLRRNIQPYLISWLRYDPAKEIAKLHIPVLIVQGTTDMQATLPDAKALANANPAATLLLIDGMNHVFKNVPNERTQQVASYSDPTLPVAPNLIGGISSFVKQVER